MMSMTKTIRTYSELIKFQPSKTALDILNYEEKLVRTHSDSIDISTKNFTDRQSGNVLETM